MCPHLNCHSHAFQKDPSTNQPLRFSLLSVKGGPTLCYDTSRVEIPYQLGRMTLLSREGNKEVFLYVVPASKKRYDTKTFNFNWSLAKREKIPTVKIKHTIKI